MLKKINISFNPQNIQVQPEQDQDPVLSGENNVYIQTI